MPTGTWPFLSGLMAGVHFVGSPREMVWFGTVISFRVYEVSVDCAARAILVGKGAELMITLSVAVGRRKAKGTRNFWRSITLSMDWMIW